VKSFRSGCQPFPVRYLVYLTLKYAEGASGHPGVIPYMPISCDQSGNEVVAIAIYDPSEVENFIRVSLRVTNFVVYMETVPVEHYAHNIRQPVHGNFQNQLLTLVAL